MSTKEHRDNGGQGWGAQIMPCPATPRAVTAAISSSPPQAQRSTQRQSKSRAQLVLGRLLSQDIGMLSIVREEGFIIGQDSSGDVYEKDRR